MDLSIVIVSWNTRALLADCLGSLATACGDLTHEVLVVDNASADGSPDMVQADFPHVRLIPSGGNLGFSKGNNLAFPHTAGDFVLLLNPDTVCPAGSLAALVAFARTRDNLGVAGPMLTDAQGAPTISYGFFPRPRHHWLSFLDPGRILNKPPFQNRVVHVPAADEPSAEVEYIAGACFLIPRAALDRVGHLDERFFMYFEETDWCWRARQAGLTAWYCAEVKVAHLEGQAAARVSRFSLLQLQKSYRLFVAKNYGPHQVWKFRVAQFLEYGLKWLLRRLLPGEKNRMLAANFRDRASVQLQASVDVEIPS